MYDVIGVKQFNPVFKSSRGLKIKLYIDKEINRAHKTAIISLQT